MLDFLEEDFEAELELLVANVETRHPIHLVIIESGTHVTATGSTDGACMLCSPSSSTRCGGGFTKCSISRAIAS